MCRLLVDVHVMLFVERNTLCPVCEMRCAQFISRTNHLLCELQTGTADGNDIFAGNFQTFINLVCLFVTRPRHRRGKRIANDYANFYGDGLE